MKEIVLKNRKIGGDNPCYIIAEMSANHGGDYDRAIEIIHKAKEAGADCIKLQTYTADTITLNSKKDYFKLNGGLWDGKYLYELYDSAFTPWEWHEGLKIEAEKLGLDFLSTPFDPTAVDFLDELGVEFYKIASFECVDIPLIKKIASKNKPIIMSTGLASLGEIEEAVEAIRNEGNNQLVVLKCSSAYPAIPDDMNIKTMCAIKDTFNVIPGLSDHTMGSISCIAAVALGAKVLEKHICLDRSIETADSVFSMEPDEFKKLVDDVRACERALGKVSFERSEKEKLSLSSRKSIFISKDIRKGEVFTEENIRCVRPGTGLSTRHYYDVLGKKATTNIEFGEPLKWNMIE
ncbi:MAG: pseudaminic acid synthase [Firmicutes bacterium]|jgi:pseudaminic acid synthase|nr:pseudaminic acid synthase [Bacillota bacterium]